MSEKIKRATDTNILDISEDTFRDIFKLFLDHEVYFTFRPVCALFKSYVDSYINLKGIFLLSHNLENHEWLNEYGYYCFNDTKNHNKQENTSNIIDNFKLIFVFSRKNKVTSMFQQSLPNLPHCKKYDNLGYKSDTEASWYHHHYPSFGRMIKGKLVMASDCRVKGEMEQSPTLRTQSFYEYDTSLKKWNALEPVHSQIYFNCPMRRDPYGLPRVFNIGDFQILHVDPFKASIFTFMDKETSKSSKRRNSSLKSISNCSSQKYLIKDKSSSVDRCELNLKDAYNFLTPDIFGKSGIVQLEDDLMMFICPSSSFDCKYF